MSDQQRQRGRATRPQGADEPERGGDLQRAGGSTLGLIRKVVALAGPVALTQLGLMGFGLVDTLMLGRVGIVELDAAALGNVWLWGTMILGIGIVMGLDPIIAQAHGRGDGARAGLALQQGLIVVAGISLPLIGALYLTEEVLLAVGQELTLAHAAESYIRMQAWSIAPLLVFYALRQYLQGRGLVSQALWLTLLANLFNIAANQVLIFGLDGIGVPAMGLEGAGLATGCTRAFMAVGLALWIWRGGLHRGAWEPWSVKSFAPAGLLELLRIGLPVGLQYALELWAFQLSTLLAGELGREQLAAHTIVLNVASVSFMIPLGVSIGVSTVIGNLIGAGRREAAQRVAWIGFALGGGAMLCSAVVIVSARHLIPTWYTQDLAVIAFAASIMPIAAAFQLFDGLQVVGGGILRGIGDTLPAAVFNAIAYYGVALPLAAYSIWVLGAGLVALWWSMALGLALVAITLVLWVRVRGPARRG